MHEQLGFVRNGYEREVVFKFGRWFDSVWMQLIFASDG
jgi:L-amino acid N-acyltransferase YncA